MSLASLSEVASLRILLSKASETRNHQVDGKLTLLDQYISRMKYGQKDILYIIGPNKEQLEKSLYLERLKTHVGNYVVQSKLPALPCEIAPHPQAIQDRRMVKRKNQATTQVLVHWKGLSPSDATWEFADDLCLRLPQFLKAGEIVTGSRN